MDDFIVYKISKRDGILQHTAMLDSAKMTELTAEVFKNEHTYADIREKVADKGIVGMAYDGDNTVVYDVDFTKAGSDCIVLPARITLRNIYNQLFFCKYGKIYVRADQFPDDRIEKTTIKAPKAIYIETEKKLSEDARKESFEKAALEWTKVIIGASNNVMQPGDSVTISRTGEFDFLAISKLNDNGIGIDAIGEIFQDKQELDGIVKKAAEIAGIEYINDRKNKTKK